MNKPFQPASASANARDDASYDDDGYGWAMTQAAHFRARRLDAIDWDNVAEEIESVGKREYGAAESALHMALMHLLKWRHQPLYRSRSWENSIREHLRRFDRRMAENPSLKSHLPDILAEAYRRARADAAQETGLLPESFPAEPPGWDEIRGPLDA